MRRIIQTLIAAMSAACACSTNAIGQPPAEYPSRMVLVIVCDGLRPDLITAEHMPALHAMGTAGVWFDNHHAVFPTVTRVNASALATGCYPAKTGIAGNSIYVPQIDPTGGLSTGSASALLKYEKVLNHPVIRCETIGDVLKKNTMRLAVASSGSSGSAFLLDASHQGTTAHYSYFYPPDIKPRVIERLDQAGPDATPNVHRNAYAVRAYLDYLLPEVKPHLTFLWLSDPDHTQHRYGLGAPKSMQAIHQIDALIGKIRDTLTERKLADRTNVFVVSDHGFSTHTGKVSLTAMLIKAGLKKSPKSDDVVITSTAIHVNQAPPERVAKIVSFLQTRPEIGAIFTAPRAGDTGPWGAAPATFSSSFIQWAHPGSGQILLSTSWTDRPGPFAYRGTTAAPGLAGHGSASPFDVRNTLIATGPDLRAALRSPVPSANVDLAPTICRLLGIKPPSYMDGRVLIEAFQTGPDPLAVPWTAEIVGHPTKPPYLRTSIVKIESHQYRYLDHAAGKY